MQPHKLSHWHGNSKLLWWLLLFMLLGVYIAVDGMPKLVAYRHMTPAQKEFYMELESREFTKEEIRNGADFSSQFESLYSLRDISSSDLAKTLIGQGFRVQTGLTYTPDKKIVVSEDGALLRRQIYPGLKGQFQSGDVVVFVPPPGGVGTESRLRIGFLSRFAF